MDENNMSMVGNIKSVLRYPGGKSKALKQILPLIPRDIMEFREPFVGGGSVSIALKQMVGPNVSFFVNDLNYDLYCFWKYCKDDAEGLVEAIGKIKENSLCGRTLYETLTSKWERNREGNREQVAALGDFERAVRFFVLNRITFSGTVDSGGYSEQAFEKRFTWSAIRRIKDFALVIRDFEVSHGDYEPLLLASGDSVFIYLDPPYFQSTKSRLYGSNGDLHVSFDHERFAWNVRRCPHRWLITYDDSPEIRRLFSFANIYSWELQYGMNNYKQEKAAKGRELFIANYELNSGC
jgi:DNA adenine methylase